MILPTSPGYDADRKGYDLRQKQLKSPVAGATDKPNLKNEETEYAPDLAPYIEFSGELRQDLTVDNTAMERFEGDLPDLSGLYGHRRSGQ